jgi:hypothetical protein
MPTELRKRVVRRTTGDYDWRGRKIVVMLEPGDVIGMREERRRKVFRAPISRVFVQLIRWNVDAERAEKAAERKKRREMRGKQ